MITKNNSVLSSASQSLYEMNADDIIRQKCRAREDYIKVEQAALKFGEQVKILQQELTEKDFLINEKDSLINEKNSLICKKDSFIAEQNALIEALKKQLAEKQN